MAKLFRPNVAGILQDANGKILVCERLAPAGNWQFPQGGIDEGETALQALHRELEEELGLKPHHYEVLDQRDGFRYQFPKGRLKFGKYAGQEQTYFLCRFTADPSVITTETAHPEFRQTRWITPESFQKDWVPAFKQAVFQEVMKAFFGVKLAA